MNIDKGRWAGLAGFGAALPHRWAPRAPGPTGRVIACKEQAAESRNQGFPATSVTDVDSHQHPTDPDAMAVHTGAPARTTCTPVEKAHRGGQALWIGPGEPGRVNLNPAVTRSLEARLCV